MDLSYLTKEDAIYLGDETPEIDQDKLLRLGSVTSPYDTFYKIDFNNDQKDENGKYIRRERYAGSCERTFYVGDEVKREDINGEFKHGILKLFIPKKEARPAAEQKKYITIE